MNIKLPAHFDAKRGSVQMDVLVCTTQVSLCTNIWSTPIGQLSSANGSMPGLTLSYAR